MARQTMRVPARHFPGSLVFLGFVLLLLLAVEENAQSIRIPSFGNTVNRISAPPSIGPAAVEPVSQQPVAESVQAVDPVFHAPPVVEEPAPQSALISSNLADTPWTKLGPGGDHQVWPAFDSADPNVLYLGQYGVGFWKSPDRGKTWELLGDEPTTLATHIHPFLSQANTFTPMLRTNVIPFMEGYRPGIERYGSISYIDKVDNTVFVAWRWMDWSQTKTVNGRPGQPLVDENRYFLSQDNGKTWEYLGTSEHWSYEVLVLIDEYIIRVYSGDLGEGFLWTKEVPRRQ